MQTMRGTAATTRTSRRKRRRQLHQISGRHVTCLSCVQRGELAECFRAAAVTQHAVSVSTQLLLLTTKSLSVAGVRLRDEHGSHLFSNRSAANLMHLLYMHLH